MRGAGSRWGHRQQPRGQSKMKAMARARSAGLKGEFLGGGGGNCWNQKGSERGGDPGPGERVPGAAVDRGLGSLPGEASGCLLAGLLGVGRPQTDATAVLCPLKMPC